MFQVEELKFQKLVMHIARKTQVSWKNLEYQEFHGHLVGILKDDYHKLF